MHEALEVYTAELNWDSTRASKRGSFHGILGTR